MDPNFVYFVARAAAAAIAVRLNLIIGVLQWFEQRGMGVHFALADGDVFTAGDLADALAFARFNVRAAHALASVHCEEVGY